MSVSLGENPAMTPVIGVIGALVLALVVGSAVYIRVAGDDPARWHVPPEPALSLPVGDEVVNIPRGAVARVAGGTKALARVAGIAAQTPRTTLLAGSVLEGRMTWVTRSAFWGFPDYTTAQSLPDGSLGIWARQRYGRGDHGVNALRLKAWIAE